MNSTSRYALLAALGLAIVAVAPAAPAFAKKKQEEAPKAPPIKLSPAVQNALAPAQQALNKNDAAAAEAAIAKARAAASTPDEKFMVAQFALNAAQVAKDQAKLSAALDEVIATGEAAQKLSQEDRAKYYMFQGQFAYQAQNYAKASEAMTKAIAAGSTDSNAYVILADAQSRNKNNAAAAATIQKAIDIERAANRQVPQSWFELASNSNAMANQVDPYVKVSTQWLGSYPSKKTWANVLNNYRAVAKVNQQVDVDLLRLARATGAMPLMSGREYNDLLLGVYRAYPAEAVDVIKEGISAKKMNPSDRDARELLPISEGKVAQERKTLAADTKTASGPAAKVTQTMAMGDVWYGYKDFAKAAELYKIALTKPGVDANLANLRLGAALAQAGDKAGALAALNNVTAKPYADLAAFWKVWVEHPATA
jgi:hypothetical protein